ncbi:TrmH family RNA methyltransferase, partial [Enterobacter cloacae complex sp.6722787]|uniref:TrmH family RNA methyltransferase n=1 Tax=Enterobacter cloacae complex sp.6722787 TaxID=3397174 RepID=UPI003AAD2B2B
AKDAPVAIVFGRERVGLTNEELQRCNYRLYIPTNPEYGSLNLAMAVQLVSYEIRMAYLAIAEKNTQTSVDDEVEYPPAEDLERFYGHLESVLNESGFIRK